MIKIVLSFYFLTAFVAGGWLYERHFLVTPGLFPLGGLVFGFGLWLLCKQIRYFSGTQRTYGQLVGWGEEKTPVPNSPRVYHYAQVVFQADDGSEHHVTSATGDRIKPKTPIGSPIPVRYDPANADDARVDTIFDFWGPSILVMFFGAVTLGMAFVKGGQ